MEVFKQICAKKHFPDARSGHRIIVTESDLYSIGGYNPDLWGVPNVSDITNYPLFREVRVCSFSLNKNALRYVVFCAQSCMA